MPEEVDPVLRARSRIAVAARRRDPEAEAEARRELALAKIRKAVAENIAKAPPLSAEQLETVASVLRGAAR